MNNPEIDRDKMSDVSITDLIAEMRKTVAPHRRDLDAGRWLTGVDMVLCIEKVADALESVTAPTEGERDALTDAVGDALDDAMLCHRVWEAWGVGTMTEDDFSQASDDEEFVAQIVDAVIAVRLPVTAPTEPERVAAFAELRALTADEVTPTEPFPEAPHVQAKYWAELVTARNRIAELEGELADMSALAQVNAMNVSDYSAAVEDAKQARAALAAVQQPNREALIAAARGVGIIREKGEQRDYPTRILDAILAALPIPSQPVQVEVTNEMVERGAMALDPAPWRSGHPASLARQDMVRRQFRAALEAALGGADHE